MPSSNATGSGPGRNGASSSVTQTGPEPGPPPPCGVENVLCRLMCMRVEAHVARARLAENRVEVGAVAVRVRADGVHGLGDLERSAGRTARPCWGS